MEKRPLGKTGLMVTPICFGTSSLGDMPGTYGYSVSEARARATLEAVFEGPVNFLDTSRNYGMGRSEARVGAALRARGGLPRGFVLSTKVDRDMDTGRFDAARVRESLGESLEALGLDRIDLLQLHDPEHARDLEEITREGGALDELFKLKEEGVVSAVGLAMGRLDIMEPILRAYPFDALISHNRYTLLNQSADGLFDLATERGIAVLNAAPYAGGVLAKGSALMPRITYQEADAEALAPVQQIEDICARYNLPPGAAALQFSMSDPRITSTIVGVTKPARVSQTLAWAAMEIPPEAAAALAALPASHDDPEADRAYHPG